jgi:MFS family permease
MSPSAASALPRPTPAYRWLALVLASLAMFGNYYAYDALNPVVDLLRTQEGLDYGQIAQLSTAYNIAALLVLLAGGLLIDRFGARRAICSVSVPSP